MRRLLPALSLTLCVAVTVQAQTTRLAPAELETRDEFGASVALVGSLAVVGARGDDDAGNGKGAVYVYDISGGTPARAAKLFSSRPDRYGSGQPYGIHLDTDGTRVVVGVATAAGGTGFPAYPPVGIALVYERDGAGAWIEDGYIENPAGSGGFHAFGTAVALQGDVLVIGAPDERADLRNAGKAYVYRRGSEGWSLEAELLPSVRTGGAHFGSSLDVDGDRVAVGAPGTTDVWIFERDASGWAEVATVGAPDPATANLFGKTVRLSGDRFVTHGTSTNDAFVYARGADGTWTVEGTMHSRGVGLALDGTRLAIGEFSPGPDPTAGHVTLYDFADGTWAESATLTAATDADARFGVDVALDGETLLVGAVGETGAATTPGDFAGGAYLLTLTASSTERPDDARALQVEAYPNPATSTVTFALATPSPTPGHLDLFDLMGRAVPEAAGPNAPTAAFPAGAHHVEVDVSGLAPGIYFARVQTRDGVRTRAFVVAR